ncbi:BrnT family toxin [Larkinella ripae]
MAKVESIFYDLNFIAVPDRIDKAGEQQYHGLGISHLNTIKYVVFVIRNGEVRPISCRTAS